MSSIILFTNTELLHCVETHRQQVLHGDHKAGVTDEPVPQTQDVSDGLHQHAASKQHEVETGHKVTQTENVDPSGASDEYEAQHQPEEIAEHKHLHHVKVAPGGNIKGNIKGKNHFLSFL